jgi:hypothetical protein
MNRIIYKNDNGSVVVVIATQKAIDDHGIMEIAKKDVPAGKPFKIVDELDIPSDRFARHAWTVDEAELTDGIGGESHEFD